MSASIRERFLPRFLESARSRVARVQAVLATDDEKSFGTIASEMHALAGEAAVLEFTEVASLAREGEAGARRSDREACLRSLAALGQAVESLAR